MKKLENTFKLDLQLFAESEGTTETVTTTAETVTGTTTEAETAEEKKFTQKDLDKIINERLTKEKNKFGKTLEQEKKLAAMTAEEQEREKFRIEKEEFLNEKKTIAREKMVVEIAKQLANEKLPLTFAERLYAEDAETVKENINKFKKDWSEELEKAVLERVKGKTPVTGITAEGDDLLKSIRGYAGLK